MRELRECIAAILFLTGLCCSLIYGVSREHQSKLEIEIPGVHIKLEQSGRYGQ